MKKFITLTVAFFLTLILCCILFGCGTTLTSDLPLEESTDYDDQIAVEDKCIRLSDIISKEVLLVTINAFGETSILEDAEITKFFDIVKEIEYVRAEEDDTILKPGAASIRILLEYSDGNIQDVTLPYFLYDDDLYVTDFNSGRLLSPFF